MAEKNPVVMDVRVSPLCVFGRVLGITVGVSTCAQSDPTDVLRDKNVAQTLSVYRHPQHAPFICRVRGVVAAGDQSAV